MPRAIAVRRRVKEPPEESGGLRVLVLAITELSILAVAAVGALDAITTIVSLGLVAVGSWLSFRRRSKRNAALKAVIAAGLLAALWGFLTAARTASSVEQARGMLGSLFVWVQVLHAFDLPRRRDLAFSVVASVALVAEAGSLSLDSTFGLVLLPYTVLVATWLYLSDRTRARGEGEAASRPRQPTLRPRRTVTGPVRAAAVPILVGAVASAAVFLATPRLPGTRVLAPPFSLVHRVGVPAFSGAVVNPDLAAGTGGGPGAVRGAGYPGFGSRVDLRVRGSLSNRLVMRVRSPQPAFWRAQVYDTFDGTTWTAPDPSLVDIGRGADQYVEVPSIDPGLAPVQTVVQTFYVVQRQPNIVFAAFRPTRVYFPASHLAVDRFGSVRSPILLEPGTVYSVVSDIPVTTPSLLRATGRRWGPRFLRQYTELPGDLPARVVRLAHRIADPEPTTYDKVMAVQRWLQVHTRYRLDIPADPPGVDAVDYFLFERREGYCEHIASAMAVLLRAVGVPARFAVGFDVGHHNLLTGYYEIHEADAHSWVEVDYPGVGWVEYDPTHDVPAAAPGLGARFIAPQVFAAIGRFLARVVPGPVKEAGRAVGLALAAGAGAAARSWPGLGAGIFVSGVALVLWRRRRRSRRDPPPAGAAAAFLSVCRVFERRGLPRPPHRTAGEHLAALLDADPVARASRDDLEVVVGAFERERFSGLPPQPQDVGRAQAAAARVRDRAR